MSHSAAPTTSLSPAPSHELEPDEPNTPFWLTALGAGLFLLVGIFVLLNSSENTEGNAVNTPQAEPSSPGSPTSPK